MNKLVNLSVLIAAASSALACGPSARMVPPAEVAAKAKVLDVADRSSMTGALADESFKLGAYSVEKVDRDWNSSKSAGVGGWSSDAKTTGYTYELKTGAGSWKGTCASLQEEQSVGSMSFGTSMNITCECELKDTKASLQLGGQADTDNGVYKAEGASYQVKAVEETDKSHFGAGPAGYRVDDGDSAVAAVEVIRPGRVWLDKALSDKDGEAMTCTLVGMMLYVPPSDN